MKDNTAIWLLFTLFCLMTSIAIFQTVSLKTYDCKYNQVNNSCDMRFPNKIIEKIDGVYHHPDYFCIWTEGRSKERISSTTFHELAHYYNYVYSEHFVDDFKDYNFIGDVVDEK